jgi:hypothetical protein
MAKIAMPYKLLSVSKLYSRQAHWMHSAAVARAHRKQHI